MDRRRLPTGIQTFRRIREEGYYYYYVDKTGYARRIAQDAGTHFFLSRPRRFRKSLFVDMLKELYARAASRCSAAWRSMTSGTGRSTIPSSA